MSQLDLHTGRDRARERRGRRAALVALLLMLLLLGGVTLGGYLLIRSVFAGPQDYPGPGSGEVVVEVEPGDSATAIGRRLEQAGVVASVEAFADAAGSDERSISLQPGFYALREQMRAADALELLLDPASRVESRVTVPEGLRLERTLDVLAQGTGIPRQRFEQVLERPGRLGLPAWTGGRAEGVLFPATYTVAPDATAAEVIDLMVRRFEQAAADLDLAGGARGLDVRELVTVASLVEAEAPPDAMDRVARVVYNRLEAGMPLQFDSTVNYATGKTGITTTPEDRASDSPYNTYRVRGLPPGPINSPGEAALRAALQPAEGPWLFFVTVNPDTGETRFAETAEEHQANVAEFQQWLREQDGDG